MCIEALSDSKYSYQPRPNIVKNEKSGLVTESHSIPARRRNRFSQLLNVGYMKLMMLGRQKYMQQNH